MIKIDLHTHSTASKDGGITLDQYKKILSSGKLDVIAITDHDRIDFAQKAQSILGEQIIVGQEISTLHGDIVGLYLKTKIKPGLSLSMSIEEIHAQGGVVCIPHPFEKIRKGVSLKDLNSVADTVDCIEGYNGRASLQNNSDQAISWGASNLKSTVANSDAHGIKGLGHTYTVISSQPKTPQKLLKNLQSAELVYSRPPLTAYLYPKINKAKKLLKVNK